MTQIIRSLADLSGRYDALFCDLWGCLHNGVTPFPAAVAALQAFRAGGGKVILVTNAPRPKSSIIKQLKVRERILQKKILLTMKTYHLKKKN